MFTYRGNFELLFDEISNHLASIDEYGRAVRWIYFCRFSLDQRNVVKIGMSAAPSERFKSLVASLPPLGLWKCQDLGIIRVCGNKRSHAAEASFIEAFVEYHVHDEWLRLPDDVQNQVRTFCQGRQVSLN